MSTTRGSAPVTCAHRLFCVYGQTIIFYPLSRVKILICQACLDYTFTVFCEFKVLIWGWGPLSLWDPYQSITRSHYKLSSGMWGHHKQIFGAFRAHRRRLVTANFILFVLNKMWKFKLCVKTSLLSLARHILKFTLRITNPKTVWFLYLAANSYPYSRKWLSSPQMHLFWSAFLAVLRHLFG